MVFTDWTFSGSGNGALDPSVTYSGLSSYRSEVSASTNYLTHNTFSEPQLQVICWARIADISGSTQFITHSSYGDLEIVDANNEWQKWRVTFWYDISANTKFGRAYKWDGSDWVQQGTDTNFGAGSPAAGTVALKHTCNTSTKYVWFDDVEIFA